MSDQKQRRLTLPEVVGWGRGPAYTIGLRSMRLAEEADRLVAEAMNVEAESAELAEAARALAELAMALTNRARDEALKDTGR